MDLHSLEHAAAAFTEVSQTAGVLLASHAAVALSSPAHTLRWNRPSPRATRSGQAMALLMARHYIAENDAFNVLRRYSQDNNVKLSGIVRQVSEQGRLP
ncbi:ANTAR domain-containing protein [Streptomyces parvus]